MRRVRRFSQMLREQGIRSTFSVVWDWIRWRFRGAPIPRVPVTTSEWVSVHENTRPDNPQPGTFVSVVIPVYDTPPDLLRACVNSVREQTHQNWEIILVDDASPAIWIADLLTSLAQQDDRIRVERRTENGGIAAATNTGIAAAKGAYVAFLDHDDLLVRTALEWVSACTPAADLIYTDEAKIGLDGEMTDRVLKPSWSPRLLLAYNYISHFSVVRTELLRRIGGISDDASGAQDHDLMIRIAEQPVTVAHVPSVLYLWRRIPESTADDPAAKPYAEQAGIRAIAAAIDRRGWRATSGIGRGVPFKYSMRWLPDPDHRPRVKAVIPTRDRVDLLRRAITGLMDRTDHIDLDIVIVDNGSEEAKTLKYLKNLATDPAVTVVRVDDAFNFSRLCNIGTRYGPKAESLLFFNNDVEVLHRDWLLQMHGWFDDNEVVAVGTELLYDDLETIQHAGVAVGSGHIGWHFSSGLANQPRLGDPHDSSHEVMGVTAACMLVRTAAFDAVGGFEEILPTDFQDVDFCLKLRRQLGGVIVYEPMFPLMHHESASRGSLNAGSGYTVSRMRFRWPGLDEEVDPYFHPLAAQPYLGEHAVIEVGSDLASLLAPRIVSSRGWSGSVDSAEATSESVG